MKRILSVVVVIVFLSLIVSTNSLQADGQHNKRMYQDQSIGICPVKETPATKDFTYTYKGKAYYFCCPECVELFKENPEEYISKIKDIKVSAFRYGYTPEVIQVNKGDIVKLSVTSKDVPHGLYIKEYGINIKSEKDKVERIEFIADKKGEFEIKCSVYCGPGHSKMKGKLIVK